AGNPGGTHWPLQWKNSDRHCPSAFDRQRLRPHRRARTGAHPRAGPAGGASPAKRGLQPHVPPSAVGCGTYMNADSPGGLRAGTRGVGLALVVALLPWSTPRAGGSSNSPSQPPPSQPPPAQAPAKSAQQTRSKKPVSPPPHHILETIIATRAAGILGVKVEGLTGEPMGLVVDIVVG